MAELEIAQLKQTRPMQGPPPDMSHVRGGFSSPSELKRAAQSMLLEQLKVEISDEGKG